MKRFLGAFVLSIATMGCGRKVTVHPPVVHNQQTWAWQDLGDDKILVYWLDPAAEKTAMAEICNHSYVCRTQPLHVVLVERTRK